jgi:hypothetical protein
VGWYWVGIEVWNRGLIMGIQLYVLFRLVSIYKNFFLALYRHSDEFQWDDWGFVSIFTLLYHLLMVWCLTGGVIVKYLHQH